VLPRHFTSRWTPSQPWSRGGSDV
jgi:hypothetical protein